jgi:hypothetical protein
MSFAYIQGQEAEALDYFDKRLQITSSPEEREQLKEIVRKLRAEVTKLKQPMPFPMNGLSLRSN